MNSAFGYAPFIHVNRENPRLERLPFQLACLVVTRSDFRPVHDFPPIGNVFLALILMFKIIGVFPHINGKQGNYIPLGQVLMLLGL
ncbi:hypothetical protein D3C85_1466420 [compost metagenome]